MSNGFSLTAGLPTGSQEGSDNKPKATKEEWNAWNEYLVEQIGDFKSRIGLVKVIADFGYQPQPDAEYEWTKSEEEKVAILEKFPDNYFKEGEDGKTYQCRPQSPEKEVGIMIDFPEIMIDYSKHPMSDATEPDLKPYRHSLNSQFWSKARGKMITGKHITLRRVRNKATGNWELSDKNLVRKISVACGVESAVKESTDVGQLSDKCCMFTLGASKKVKGEYTNYNFVAKDPTMKHDLIPDPECETNFVGILMNGKQHSEDEIKMIRQEWLNVMELCVHHQVERKSDGEVFVFGQKWTESDLYKQLIDVGRIKPVNGESVPQCAVESPQQAVEPVKQESNATTQVKQEAPINAPEPPTLDDNFDDLPF